MTQALGAHPQRVQLGKHGLGPRSGAVQLRGALAAQRAGDGALEGAFVVLPLHFEATSRVLRTPQAIPRMQEQRPPLFAKVDVCCVVLGARSIEAQLLRGAFSSGVAELTRRRFGIARRSAERRYVSLRRRRRWRLRMSIRG